MSIPQNLFTFGCRVQAPPGVRHQFPRLRPHGAAGRDAGENSLAEGRHLQAGLSGLHGTTVPQRHEGPARKSPRAQGEDMYRCVCCNLCMEYIFLCL